MCYICLLCKSLKFRNYNLFWCKKVLSFKYSLFLSLFLSLSLSPLPPPPNMCSFFIVLISRSWPYDTECSVTARNNCVPCWNATPSPSYSTSKAAVSKYTKEAVDHGLRAWVCGSHIGDLNGDLALGLLLTHLCLLQSGGRMSWWMKDLILFLCLSDK